MPSIRVFYLLALTTVLCMVGAVVPGLAYLALGLDAALVLAILWDHHRASKLGLLAERKWPELLAQGASSEIEVVLQSPGEQAFQVRLRETLHPALAAQPERTELEMKPGRRRSWRYSIRPRRRGRYSCGPLTARVLGPWGLAWHQRRLLGDQERKVYPQIRWQGKVGRLLLLAQRRSLGRHPQRVQGLGSEPYALREYLPGDALNRIHWKASARHDRLVTREDTWERGARLVVLLDCARSMSGLDGERSKLDHALAAALALTRVAARRGDQVTLGAFSDRIERQVRIRGGHRSMQAAYGAIFDLQSRAVEPAFDLAAEAAFALESRRSTVVLLTSVVDLASAELLRRAVMRLERRHRPILINLQDPELVALAEEVPHTAPRTFAKAAALEILLANRALGVRLRHSGIRVVSTAADRLALETLEAYLTLFGRGV